MRSDFTVPSLVPTSIAQDAGTVLLIAGTVDKHRLRTALERSARRVLVAVDTISARSILRREAVDVVCTSGARGLEFIDQCREETNSVSSILIAKASDLPQLAVRLSHGPSTTTTRIAMESWSEDDLVSCIEEALDTPRLRRENARLANALEESQQLIGALASAANDGSGDASVASVALTDPLTGIPNRMLILNRLERALECAQRNQGHVAVISFGLDRFKLVNSGLGQRAGDELLKALAKRLQSETRSSDSVARISGDEFAFIVSTVTSNHHVSNIAKRIARCLESPFFLQGREIFTSASIGISVFPHDGSDAEELLRGADEAMQLAKKAGGGHIQFHSANANEQTRSRLTLEAELRRGLERDEFELFYQPRVDAMSGTVTGAEALLRWRHPQKGLVPPGQFIPLLEDTGLIAPVGRWVLDTAGTTLARWNRLGLGNLALSVNLSPRQFTLCDLESDVRNAVSRTGLPAGSAKLELEITESLMLTDYAHSAELLRRFREAGIQVAMDDFGTGYSSLSYLSSLPLDVLKIDRAFIAKLGESSKADALVVAIIAMAHNLNLSIVAEGVETEAQWRFLQNQAIEELQGYFFGAPVPEAEFLSALATPPPYQATVSDPLRVLG